MHGRKVWLTLKCETHVYLSVDYSQYYYYVPICKSLFVFLGMISVF